MFVSAESMRRLMLLIVFCVCVCVCAVLTYFFPKAVIRVAIGYSSLLRVNFGICLFLAISCNRFLVKLIRTVSQKKCSVVLLSRENVFTRGALEHLCANVFFFLI